MNDPFEWLTVVGGGAFEYYNDHVSINRSVVPVYNRPVVIHRFAMSRPKRAQWHHVEVLLEAFKFDGSDRLCFCLAFGMTDSKADIEDCIAKLTELRRGKTFTVPCLILGCAFNRSVQRRL